MEKSGENITFGPQWLLKHATGDHAAGARPPTHSAAKTTADLAKHRYTKEELLEFYDGRSTVIPKGLKENSLFLVDISQTPLLLTPVDRSDRDRDDMLSRSYPTRHFPSSRDRFQHHPSWRRYSSRQDDVPEWYGETSVDEESGSFDATGAFFAKTESSNEQAAAISPHRTKSDDTDSREQDEHPDSRSKSNAGAVYHPPFRRSASRPEQSLEASSDLRSKRSEADDSLPERGVSNHVPDIQQDDDAIVAASVSASETHSDRVVPTLTSSSRLVSSAQDAKSKPLFDAHTEQSSKAPSSSRLPASSLGFKSSQYSDSSSTYEPSTLSSGVVASSGSVPRTTLSVTARPFESVVPSSQQVPTTQETMPPFSL